MRYLTAEDTNRLRRCSSSTQTSAMSLTFSLAALSIDYNLELHQTAPRFMVSEVLQPGWRGCSATIEGRTRRPGRYTTVIDFFILRCIRPETWHVQARARIPCAYTPHAEKRAQLDAQTGKASSSSPRRCRCARVIARSAPSHASYLHGKNLSRYRCA